MTKKIVILLLVMLPTTSSYSEIKAPSPVALYFFAHTQAEINDKQGRYLNVNPPVKEYRKFTKWDASELSLSPNKFDAIAIVSNNGSNTVRNVMVHFEISAKVGKLAIDKQVGVADVEYGKNSAQWRPPEKRVSLEIVELLKNKVQ